MRILVAALSVLISLFSVTLDLQRPRWDCLACRLSLCRFDQLFASIEATGMSADNLRGLLREDLQNPLLWCTYGDVLAAQNDMEGARAAFDRAIQLGSGMPPVLMRAANFAFVHGQPALGFRASSRILIQTPVFDELLFSYFQRSGVPVARLLGTAIPANRRAANSWLDWTRANGSTQDLTDTWIWMKQNRFLNQKSAAETISTFWERKAFHPARDLWTDWTGYKGSSRSLIANGQFRDEPAGGPFDWTITPAGGVSFARQEGLDVQFSGTENITLSNIRQGVVVGPGRYRFSIELEAHEITTDEGAFVSIFDPVNPRNLHAETPPIRGTLPRTWQSVEFSVPPVTQALVIELERRPSARFDNKIGGTLHIYQMSLDALAKR